MDQVWEKAWPFWKFGFKHDDLTTTLHDKYNTISSPIQDPDAFHHDVYEISSRADTLGDFERLMDERKALRIKELNGMLEDASFEIVGNPDLIGTEQWALAVQLFRTRSLDSLVRYFASYLPADHPWHHDTESPVDSSDSEAPSPIDYDGPMLFDEPEEDNPIYTNQSSECFSMIAPVADQPVRSMSMRSEDSGVSVGGRSQRYRKGIPPRRSLAREMSVSDSEADHASASLQNSMSLADDGTPLTHYPETPSTSISDLSDGDEQDARKRVVTTTVLDEDVVDDYLSISHTSVASLSSMMESDIETPKAEPASSALASASPFLQTNVSPSRTTGSSISRSHPHHAHHAFAGHQKPGRKVMSRHLRRREGSLDRDVLNRRYLGKPNRARQVTPVAVRQRAQPRRRQTSQEM